MLGGKGKNVSATLPWLLAFAGFVILLGGIATMQVRTHMSCYALMIMHSTNVRFHG